MKDIKTVDSILGEFGAGSGKSTSNIQNRKGKMFGYQVLGFGSGGDSFGDPITATGGTITEVGNFKVHVFTGGGTFAVQQVPGCQPGNVDYIVVGGGGSAQAAMQSHAGLELAVVDAEALRRPFERTPICEKSGEHARPAGGQQLLCLLLRQDRCLLLRQDRCLLLRQDR